MKLSDFDYEFPEELVAQHPLPERTASRMMVINRASGTWEHGKIADLPNFIGAGDIIVVNDSKVIPARIFGERSGGKPIELLLVDKTDETRTDQWRCLTKRVRQYRRGDKLFFGMSATATVVGRDGDFLVVEFLPGHRERAVERRGVPPLPPYIRRTGFHEYTDEDRMRYQTVYAKNTGSAAAPTAGLHFSEELLQKLKHRGAQVAPVTLHVGADTFAPVRVDSVHEHKMHGERFLVSATTAEIINKARSDKKRIIAIGTTTVRALESAVHNGELVAGTGDTHLFITPGFEFQIVDGLLTNFHQPRSTLLMLVSAFAGKKLIRDAYEDALHRRYRLFSYGDCMLII